MFLVNSDIEYKELMEGILLKPLAYGEKTMLCEFRLEKGRMLPLHSHPHEQTGYLLSGRMNMIIGDEKKEARVGDSWSIPGGAEHGAEVMEDAVVVEVFCPVREDYLP